MKAQLTLNVPGLTRAIVAHLAMRIPASTDDQANAMREASRHLELACAVLGTVLIHRVDVSMLDVVERVDMDLTT